jgi:GNAT superfamily N-acetyltransferase
MGPALKVVRVARATAGDIPALVAIHREVLIAAYPKPELGITTQVLERHTSGKWLQTRTTALTEALKTESAALFAGRLDGKLVGFAEARLWETPLDPGELPWLTLLYVLPEAHGHGVGRFLLAAAVNWLRERRPDQAVHLIVVPGTAAVAFYHHMGFAPTGRDVSALVPTLNGGYQLPQMEMILIGEPRAASS